MTSTRVSLSLSRWIEKDNVNNGRAAAEKAFERGKPAEVA